MEKLIKSARLAVMGLVTLAMLAVAAVTLYKLQIIEGQAYYEESRNNVTSYQRVAAARGSIMDRYGRVLVENRVCNDLVIDINDLFREDDPDYANANAAILTLVNTLREYGDSHIDTLPITKLPPFEYTAMDDSQSATLSAWIAEKVLLGELGTKEPTAVELMAYMRDRYKIDNSYTAEETRIIAGVRYEINSRYIHNFATSDYVFARDVSMDAITLLMENDVPGFDVVTSFIRDYNTSYASHLLGYTGSIHSDEVEHYKSLGYSLDAQVGRAGSEAAFEQYLHGTDGMSRVTRTASGTVTSTVYTSETVPGDHVYLTIDIGLQEMAENALHSFITRENIERAAKNEELDLYGGMAEDYQQLITGGAAVAVAVKTGEPLGIASWPGYDITDLLADWNSVALAENGPLLNRALQAAYEPGSTFKPAMAIAALAEGKITTGTLIDCVGVYTEYEEYEYTPTCWVWNPYSRTTHGELNVTGAITNSCNIFFYTLGDYLQISLMAKYAKLFGLGEHTGIELYEETGAMTSDELYQARYGRDVYAGETIAAAIGQAESQFTPIQLAEYCAAVAAGGSRHSASILKSVYSYDFSRMVYSRTAEELSAVETEREYFDAVQQGMRGVAADPVGTAYSTFQGAPYTVAAKTGTAQRGENETNNGVFICYAPYDDPEIAVAVVVEKGGAGASVAGIARVILDYYFAFRDSTMALEGENALLR